MSYNSDLLPDLTEFFERLEDLDIAKERYNKFERRLSKLVYRALALNAIVLFFFSLFREIIPIFSSLPQVLSLVNSTYVFFIFVIMLKFYLIYNIKTVIMMYKKHFYAFKTHAIRLIPLFTLTTISLIIFLLKQIAFMFWRNCIIEQREICISVLIAPLTREDCAFRGE